VNHENEYGETALIHAADKGHVEYLKALLQSEANVNRANYFGTTALTAAASKGHLECLKALLQNGSDVNQENRSGETDLTVAAFKGLHFLLTKGSNVNHQDNDGDTALICAARCGHFECLKALLNHGADVSIKGQQGGIALETAERSSSIKDEDIGDKIIRTLKFYEKMLFSVYRLMFHRKESFDVTTLYKIFNQVVN